MQELSRVYVLLLLSIAPQCVSILDASKGGFEWAIRLLAVSVKRSGSGEIRYCSMKIKILVASF